MVIEQKRTGTTNNIAVVSSIKIIFIVFVALLLHIYVYNVFVTIKEDITYGTII